MFAGTYGDYGYTDKPDWAKGRWDRDGRQQTLKRFDAWITGNPRGWNQRIRKKAFQGLNRARTAARKKAITLDPRQATQIRQFAYNALKNTKSEAWKDAQAADILANLGKDQGMLKWIPASEYKKTYITGRYPVMPRTFRKRRYNGYNGGRKTKRMYFF